MIKSDTILLMDITDNFLETTKKAIKSLHKNIMTMEVVIKPFSSFVNYIDNARNNFHHAWPETARPIWIPILWDY